MGIKVLATGDPLPNLIYNLTIKYCRVNATK